MEPLINEQDLYYCPRCKKNNLEGEIPCPRGSCEARIEGTIITTITVNTVLSEEQKNWNKENYR